MCPSSDFKWRNIEVQKCHIFCSKLLSKIFLVNIFAGTVMSLDCSWLTVKKASIQLYIQLLPGIVFKLISKFLSTSDVNGRITYQTISELTFIWKFFIFQFWITFCNMKSMKNLAGQSSSSSKNTWKFDSKFVCFDLPVVGAS